jgi:hypothetical protein
LADKGKIKDSQTNPKGASWKAAEAPKAATEPLKAAAAGWTGEKPAEWDADKPEGWQADKTAMSGADKAVDWKDTVWKDTDWKDTDWKE